MKEIQNVLNFHQVINKSLQELGNMNMNDSFTISEMYQLAIESCDESFHGRYSSSLIGAKKNIYSTILLFLPDLNNMQLLKLKNILYLLQKNEKILLEGQLLSLRIQLTSLKEKSTDSLDLISVINQIIDILDQVLPFHFVHKQYVKRKREEQLIIVHCQEGSIHSLQGILGSFKEGDQSIEQQKNQLILKQVEKEFINFTIADFLDSHIKEEQEKIVDEMEICRLCGDPIRLKQLDVHTKYCTKEAQVELQQKKIDSERENLTQKISDLEKILLHKEYEDFSKEQFRLLRIISYLKEQQQEAHNIQLKRRNSQILNKKTYLINQIRQFVQKFEEQFGQNPLIRSLLDNREKSIENKRKMQIYRKKKNGILKDNSQIGSLNSLQETFSNFFNGNTQFRTKKSIFAQKDQKSKSSISSNANKSQQSNSSQSSVNIMTNSNLQKTQIEADLPDKTSIKYLKSIKNLKQFSGIQSEESEEKTSAQRLWKSMKSIKRLQSTKNQQMSLKDFEIIKFLGKGAFGKVYLVRRKKTGDLYALKHVKIEDQESQKMELIQKEHQIFKKIAGDHLVHAPFAFSGQYGHFFVLQFMPGGDFSELLTEEVYLEEDKAKFYLAEIILALEHLHNCQIIHRDLKPENLVIDKSGHLKLTDFGLSDIKIKKKINNVVNMESEKNSFKNQTQERNRCKPRGNRRAALVNKTQTAKIIGTPDYIAPEIINQTSINNKSIDWWSLGVIAYEMMVGCRPFAADSIEEVLNNIVQGRMQWPQIGREEDMISPEASDLIKKLLNKNFQTRLGSQNVEDIKRHSFFQGIDWDNIKNQAPPIPPKQINMELYKQLTEDLGLRAEICSQIPKKQILTKKSLKFLDNFIRFDILLEETYESAGKKINKGKSAMKRLQSLKGDYLEKESLDDSIKEKGKQNRLFNSTIGGNFVPRSSIKRKKNRASVGFKDFGDQIFNQN